MSRATPSEEIEVFVCPIDGCNRTVVGDQTAIRNHVRNLRDDAHRHRTLDDELEVVVDWEAMDWGW